MRSVELFAGCGGLALGLSRAGFKHALVVELDDHANTTLADNHRRRVDHIADWPIVHADVCNVDYKNLEGSVDLVAGGPPCQPFSIGGKHHGPDDKRNLWPEAVRALRELRPKAFLFENVRGLLRPSFDGYLKYLTFYLSRPEVAVRKEEIWTDHFCRLKQHAKESKDRSPTYTVVFRGINTADYGAPQKRHRVIAVGVRTDIATDWKFPDPTHSRDALVWAQHISGDYWKRHDINPAVFQARCDTEDRLLSRLSSQLVPPVEAPWLTVRDAIGDLPSPTADTSVVPNHQLHPGARIYPRHTGSRWDEPAKALKAGDHGVPGGENILAPGDGTVRYFTLREMARLQGFPDDFIVTGTWKGPIKQLGNAVPVQVGEIFGGKIMHIIRSAGLGVRQVAA